MAKTFPYDIEINGQGYMLARQDQLGRGARAWSVEAQGYSNVSLTQEEARYASQPPQVETAMVWTDFHHGYGDALQRHAGRYNYSINADCRFEEQVLPGPKIVSLSTPSGGVANPRKFIEHQSELLFSADRYVYKIDTSADTIALEKDTGAGMTAVDMALFNGSLYVSQGVNYKTWKRNGSKVWSQGSDSFGVESMVVQNGKLWANRYGTVDGVTSVNYISGVANDPQVFADWGALYPVGDPYWGVNGLQALGDILYVGKYNGLHALDSSGVGPLLTPELVAYPNLVNCRNMIAWHGALYVPHLRGLLRFRDAGASGFYVESVGPGRSVSSSNPIHGRVHAMVGDDRWLYIALKDDASYGTYILAGREATDQESDYGPMVWHPIAKLTGKTIDAMHITGLSSQPRLYFGMDYDVGYIVLPLFSDNPQQSSYTRYAASGSLYLSSHDLQAPTTKKVFRSIEVQADNLSASNYITVQYKVDDAASWTSLGAITSGPQGELTLSTTGISGYKIAVRLDWTQASDTTPVIVKRVAVKAAERPSTVEVFSATVRLADSLALRTGASCPRTAKTMQEELLALAESATAVTLRDPVGTEYKVLVQSPVTRQEAAQTGDRPSELLATIRMSAWE